MAKKFLFFVFLFLIFGCTENEIFDSTNENGEELVRVSLDFNPITILAKTRSIQLGVNDLIGVQVYKNISGYYYPWAHGLFSGSNPINIDLIKNEIYKFQYCIITEGKSLFSTTDIISEGIESKVSYRNIVKEYGYTAPFYLTGYAKITKQKWDLYDVRWVSAGSWEENITNLPAPLKNLFIFTQYEYYTDLFSNFDDNIQTDVLYGEKTGYIPKENDLLLLPVNRAAFGLCFKISGITDGSVTILLKNNTRTFYRATVQEDFTSREFMFSWMNTKQALIDGDNYEENATLSLSWARGNGVTEDLGSINIKLKNNKMNILNISLGANDGKASLGFSLESAKQTDSSIEFTPWN